MSARWVGKAVLGAILFALLAGSVALSSHAPITTAAAYDPIAVGNWQYDQYDSIIVAYANQYGMNPFIIKGQIMLESGFDQWAQSSVINAGCGWTYDLGLMQVNPYCNGVNANSLFNPTTNIQIGTAGDVRLYNQFGEISLALQAYNIGAAAVEAGYRNWAYSNAVENNAQQFLNEHNSIYGSGGGGSGGTYVVQAGDTLGAIGQKLRVNWQTIAQANGIYSPYIIYPGETLTIPGASQTYLVQPGDSLYVIGIRYGVSSMSIAQANGISYPYIIYPGETLAIP
ncbi:MAG: LysM peptidoglycan-binding domain-containing protein [Nitrososphaerales archaeon]